MLVVQLIFVVYSVNYVSRKASKRKHYSGAYYHLLWGFLVVLDDKESACNAGDPG